MANRKSRGPVGDSTYTCDYSIERGHGGMKQNRGNINPITGDETTVSANIFGASGPRPMFEARRAAPHIDAAAKMGKDAIAGARQTVRPKLSEKPKSPNVGPTKERAAALDAKNAKKAARQQKMAVASKAMSDMAGKMQEDQQRFSQEHDQAVQEGSAMMQRQMAGKPGRAMEIIKRKRV